MTKDYYKILGVTEFDSAEDIKLVYRNLARKFHPDVVGSSKEALLKFKEINEAYEILSNKIKREEYDKVRKFYNYAKDSRPEQKENIFQESVTKPNFNKKMFNWDDFFNKSCSKNAQNEKVFPVQGDDINTDLEINTYDAVYGTSKVINVLQTQVCPKCRGKKFVNGTICSNCNGKGEFVEHKKFNVKIPAGIKNGAKIRLAGEGEKGFNGGKNGDLYIKIHLVDINITPKEDLDIYKTITITPQEAVLGANLVINYNGSNYNINIAPQTQNGQKIRLAKCGNEQNGKIGDMIIKLIINIPDNLSEDEILLYKKIKEISTKNIRNFDEA